jgi:hypothetical protein
MLKSLILIVGLLVLMLGARSFIGGNAEPPAGPVTASASLDLRVKAQAGIQMTVASLSNRMKQVMAAGNEPAQRAALDDDLSRLHIAVDAARSDLVRLGDSSAAIDQWLGRIGWEEFRQFEARYHQAGGR